MEGLECGRGGSSRWLHTVLQAHSHGAERLRLCQTFLCQATARSTPIPSNPHAPTLLSSTPAATEAEVKNRRSLVTLYVKASCVLRGDTHWKQTIGAWLCNPDVCFSPSYLSPLVRHCHRSALLTVEFRPQVGIIQCGPYCWVVLLNRV